MLVQAAKPQKVTSISSHLYKNEQIYAVYYVDKKVFVYWRWDEIKSSLRDWAAFIKNCKNCSEESHFFILQSKIFSLQKAKIWPSSEFELDCTNNNDFDSKKLFTDQDLFKKDSFCQKLK